MAAIVYLDTQDYINIFNEKMEGPNKKVFRELIELRDEGRAVYGFSFATILEFITRPGPLFREERGRRGALIKEICQSNAFPPIWELKNGGRFPNGGQWMGQSGHKPINAKRFRVIARKTFRKEALGLTSVNRKTRRKFAGLKMEAFLAQPGMKVGSKREHYPGLPVSREVLESDLLRRFLSGKCSDEEFETAMTQWMVDPEEYSRIIYDYADNPNAMDKFFGPSIGEFEREISSVKQVLNDIKSLNERRLKLRQSLRDAGVAAKAAAAVTKQVRIPDVDIIAIREKLSSSLGAGRVEHITHYFRAFLEGQHSPKASDMFDLFQFCYTYDCDLFRCDKAMGNLFSEFEPFDGKLVTRFADLPSRIRGLTT